MPSKLSPEELKELFKKDPKKVSSILGNALREFGYPIKDSWVESEINVLLALGDREEYRGGPSLILKKFLTNGVE
jgi:hypothetical protein